MRLDAVRHQVLPGGAVLLDRARRRDVIGRDAVAEQRQDARAGDVAHRRRLHRDRLEERRVPDVGRVGLPGEAIAAGNLQVLPAIIAAEHVGVLLAEHRRGHRREHRLLNLALGRPQLAQVDRGALLVGADRLGGQVDASSSRPARRRPPAAATRGSSRAPAAECAPRSCGCRSAPTRPRGCALRLRPTRPRAADRCCRCRSCSRSRRD